MNRLTVLSVLAVLAGGLAATGCNDRTQKELTALKYQYNDLQLEKSDLQKSLKVSQDKNDELMTLLATRESELDAANAEIGELKKQPKVDDKTAPTGWTAIPGGAKIALASDILFAPGKATLSKQGTARLKQIAATIKTTYPDSVIRVCGFTDSDPIQKTKKLWMDNLDLSSNRAMAVVRLLKKSGIQAGKLEAVGMGETHPVAPNTTKEGKTRNRRVEIVAVK